MCSCLFSRGSPDFNRGSERFSVAEHVQMMVVVSVATLVYLAAARVSWTYDVSHHSRKCGWRRTKDPRVAFRVKRKYSR